MACHSELELLTCVSLSICYPIQCKCLTELSSSVLSSLTLLRGRRLAIHSYAAHLHIHSHNPEISDMSRQLFRHLSRMDATLVSDLCYLVFLALINENIKVLTASEIPMITGLVAVKVIVFTPT